MRRLRTIDAVLLVSLLALWGVCAALHVKQIIGGQLAWVGVYVAAPAGATASRPYAASGRAPTHSASGGLAVGDRVLTSSAAPICAASDRSASSARVYAAAADGAPCAFRSTYERAGTSGNTTIDLVPRRLPVAHAAAHLHAGGHRRAGAGAPAGHARSRARSSCSPSPTGCTGRSSSAARACRPMPGSSSSSAPRW